MGEGGGKIYLWLKQGCHGKILIFHAQKRQCVRLKNTDGGKKTRLSARYRGYMRQVKLREGEGVLLWDEWAVFFNIHQTRVNLDGSEGGWSRGRTDRISLSRTAIWLLDVLTSPAVPHGHFAHPGLGDGGTGYRVLGWFLNNVPRPGLQTPLIAAGFVSPGAGSPFAPLAHLAALCRKHRSSDETLQVKF